MRKSELRKIDPNVRFIVGSRGYMEALSKNPDIDGAQVSRRVTLNPPVDREVFAKNDLQKQKLKELKYQVKNKL